MIHKSKIVEMSKELCRPGIYFLYSKRKRLVYVGKSVGLRRRLMYHYSQSQWFNGRIKAGRRGFDSEAKPFEYFRYCFVPVEKLKMYEDYFINKCKPRYNGTYIYVKLPEHIITENARSLAKYM